MNGATLTTPLIHKDPMVPDLYRIEKIRNETADTFTLCLDPGENRRHCFQAGQFNMIYVFGVGEVPISISGDPTKPAILEHTIRSVGTVTKSISQFKKGQMLGIRGPFGTAWPLDQARGHDVVIIAGGIGLAPLKPSIHQILSKRDQFGHVVLLYGARTPDDLLFQKELTAWRSRFDMEVYLTVDRATLGWRGHIGVVPSLIHKASADPEHSFAMICGPEVMMRFTVPALQKYGFKDERIFISMERNMKCALGFCGHCQYGPEFICKDGPVFSYEHLKDLFGRREI